MEYVSIFQCMDIPQFIHSAVDGHLQSYVIMNKDATNADEALHGYVCSFS